MRRILSFLFLAAAPLAMAATPAKPNVLVILADDQGYGDLAATGNKQIQTPNIDSLGRSGATFQRFFVCAVCAPTRAEFLTGRYHPRGGVIDVTEGRERLNPDEKTVADAFRAAGYMTGAFGKWHNGSQWPYHPNARGFAEYYGFTSGHWGEYFDPPLEHNGQLVRGKGYIADDLTNHALDFIEANKDKPFFCYVPFNTPHSPFCVPDEYWQRHENQEITQRGELGKDEDLVTTRCVLAMNENIDWNVGRLLKRLEDLHLAENTIVIYFSDNGPATFRWNDGMKGKKGSVDEGGVRVPCFMRWPGHIPAGESIAHIAGAIDLLPTITALAGVKSVSVKPLDGKDLTPLLHDPKSPWEDRTYINTLKGTTSVRNDHYRLDQKGHLYDMVTDPGQTTDVATQHAEVSTLLLKARQTYESSVTPPDRQRPYTVGYAEFPWTPLPARDGEPHGAVKRSASAPNCSYFVNWKKPTDSVTWDVDVHTTGDYDVQFYYTCPAADVGSTLELTCGKAKLTGKVTTAWDPPLIEGQDRAPRRAESIMKEFHPMSFGTVHLEAGRSELKLQAPEIPGKTVMDLRLVTLTLKKS